MFRKIPPGSTAQSQVMIVERRNRCFYSGVFGASAEAGFSFKLKKIKILYNTNL